MVSKKNRNSDNLEQQPGTLLLKIESVLEKDPLIARSKLKKFIS
jgi:hypothetical protein